MLTTTKNRLNPWLDKLGDWNPQLFRELKGRLKSRNITIALVTSAIGQIILYLFFEGALPLTDTARYNRYCTGYGYSRYSSPQCLLDSLGNLEINWQLWWLDIYLSISIIAIFALLVLGTYMLVGDISKEESRGTLDFIRLSPQSAQSILTGKMLGVPILLYLFAAAALPLHFVAGLSAGIPLTLVLAFYLVLAASCAFFYSVALLFGLINLGEQQNKSKPISGSILVLLFLLLAPAYVASIYSSFTGNATSWLGLFYPGIVLSYLIESASLAARTSFDYHQFLDNLLFYGLPFWVKAWSGIGLILLNYGLWTYWIWQGLKRRFHNPINTLLSKKHSYWISGSFVAIAVGFTVQSREIGFLFANYIILQLLLVILFLGLIAALSPHRQTLQDWARYRHQAGGNSRSLIKDLIWGEKSPSTVAIALNLLLTTGYILPWLLLFPLEKYAQEIFFGLVASISVILIYAAIVQLMLFMKTRKRVTLALGMVGILTILPPTLFGIFGSKWLVLFSLLPMSVSSVVGMTTIVTSIMFQWLAIALISFQMTKQLHKAGESETKALLAGRS